MTQAGTWNQWLAFINYSIQIYIRKYRKYLTCCSGYKSMKRTQTNNGWSCLDHENKDEKQREMLWKRIPLGSRICLAAFHKFICQHYLVHEWLSSFKNKSALQTKPLLQKTSTKSRCILHTSTNRCCFLQTGLASVHVICLFLSSFTSYFSTIISAFCLTFRWPWFMNHNLESLT